MLFVIIIIGVIVYLVKNNNKSKQRDAHYRNLKCTGCGVLNTGKLIKITGVELKQPLYYCTQECKIEHIEQDKIKFADIEVI
jgi:hypothetical protein